MGADGFNNGPLTTASLPSAAVGSGTSEVGSIAPLALPASLAPLDELRERKFTDYFPGVGQVSGTRKDLDRFSKQLRPRPGTPLDVVQRCRQTIVASAMPYGVVRVDAASAGPMQRIRTGYSAPVEIRVVYARQGGLETRQSTIGCQLNNAGRVYAAL